MDSSDGRKNPRLTAPQGTCDTHMHFYNAEFPSAPTALMTPPDAWVDGCRSIRTP
jgi:D-galactarolactone isomerase